METIENKRIVVWFSCGVASAVAAYLTFKKYEQKNAIFVVNTPVREEHPDNKRFLGDVEEWLGCNIESATNRHLLESSAEEVWRKKKAMSFPGGAPCTVRVKKRARQQWDQRVSTDYMVLGFTADEEKRHNEFIKNEIQPVIPVLIDEGMTKKDCYKFIIENGIRPPIIYSYGFPNANCIGCVKATSPTYWNLVREHFPEVFHDRATLSRELGTKLTRVKNRRIFLDDLDPSYKGNKMAFMPECNVFCGAS